MNSKMAKRAYLSFLSLALLLGVAAVSPALHAQAAAQRFLGTVTAINGDSLTVKTDAGEVRQVQVPAAAVLKRIAPGQKDLSTAETIQLTDVATGDRVLVKLDPDSPGPPPQVAQLIAMKQSDVAQKQQKDQEAWQRNGVGGLVKSVDPSAGVVILTSGAGPTAKTVTVHIEKSTVLKRYAPTSIRYADAQTAPLDAVRVGDQFRARGQKNADGTEITAEEVVSGSFRNISGTVTSIDTAASTLIVKDLMTKKPVTIHVTPDVQMRRLPDMMSRMIAARLKGSAPGPGGATMTARPESGGAPGGPPNGQGAGPGAGPGGAGGGRRAGGGDMEQALDRAPAIKLSDLQKGEAVMLVSTQGASDVNAIKLLAGVEPLLEAPAASQNLLSSWSMGSGGAEAGGAQ
ncbi:hypothetical protein P8935_15955 [Telmatobacter sp. DSM 110680]|uniref:DUF5666 domain-containing protein n=1 Tax=Telmatobacter sp. DSM 110680 TaxID=3036704 RepID=A0AAU7DEA9_9BACT